MREGGKGKGDERREGGGKGKGREGEARLGKARLWGMFGVTGGLYLYSAIMLCYPYSRDLLC